jgi:hypothetical protein
MTGAAIIQTVAMLLLGATIGVFVLLVVGIRRGDRSAHLAAGPHTRTDALARRFLGIGIRHTASNDVSERG